VATEYGPRREGGKTYSIFGKVKSVQKREPLVKQKTKGEVKRYYRGRTARE